MEHSVNLTLVDLDDKEIFRKDNFILTSIPKIREAFDFSMDDYSFLQQIYQESKTKGRIRVADITHVYFEKDKTHSVNILLAFSNDERFKKMFWE